MLNTIKDLAFAIAFCLAITLVTGLLTAMCVKDDL
jgi:hypothetical protein